MFRPVWIAIIMRSTKIKREKMWITFRWLHKLWDPDTVHKSMQFEWLIENNILKGHLYFTRENL
jgi:hypothetical protein